MTVSAPMAARRNAREDGTVALLTIGMFAVAFGLVVSVVDVSAVYLDRRDLAGDCDSAALAASQAVDPTVLYGSGVGATLPIDAQAGSAAAAAVARTVGTGTLTRTTIGGGSVTVACTRRVTLPVGGVLGLGAFTVRAGSTASSLVR